MRSSSRRSSSSKIQQSRLNSTRLPGRVTKEDIRAASLRRWDGRARVTTDWINLFQEPELCFPDGNLFIYLREPGQSSRGPTFRVHKEILRERGFDFLIDKCIDRPPIHPGTKCLQSSCHGCDVHSAPSELYVPAPTNSDLDTIFDHHITTRNFFAWLYNIPLAGRALGQSLVTLKERIDYYRPDGSSKSALEIISYADTQRYLDFRECVDHALAALLCAECLQIEDLWIDAFSHCIGMSHRGLSASVEYWAISYETRLLINKAQEETESRILSVRQSVCDFFENDLSGNFLGLSQSARDHLDRFRSWLHSSYIEQYGFWPPGGFGDEKIERSVYASLYSDFRNLYYHLVDPYSSMGMTDLQLSASGGVCTTQNIQAYDSRHHYESLPKTMPLLPREPELGSKSSSIQRRMSWNLLAKRKADKDKRNALRTQALITASNRDWAIMQCPLVRRYSEFESQIMLDDSETISMVNGRKVRWILVYAVLQTLIPVMQTPTQVRNADGVSYFLCCRPPKMLPWQATPSPKKEKTVQKRRSAIEPDTQYMHSNSSSSESVNNKPSLSLSKQLKEIRRQSLPARVASSSSRPSSSRSASIKHFIRRTDTAKDEPPMPKPPALTKPPAFCEILVQGYGNGLNEIELTQSKSEDTHHDVEGDETPRGQTPVAVEVTEQEPSFDPDRCVEPIEKVPELTPPSSISVSRESSKASTNSTFTRNQPSVSEVDLTMTPPVDYTSQMSLPDLSKLMMLSTAGTRDTKGKSPSDNLNRVLDEDGLVRTIHFNTRTWDNFLVALE